MYVGIDAHQRDCHATVLNDAGETVSTARFPTTPKALTQWAERLPKGSVLALEASTVGPVRPWGSPQASTLRERCGQPL